MNEKSPIEGLTMSKDETLVERLRETASTWAGKFDSGVAGDAPILVEAADRIEELEANNARLRQRHGATFKKLYETYASYFGTTQ